MALAVAGTRADEPAGRTAILDTAGNWRVHHTLAPPQVKTDRGVETILAADQKWLHETTPDPPAGWRSPDFDDRRWLRGPARIATGSPMLQRLCLRGKFTVTDPATVRGLKLSVGYYGGAILYVNGREVARGHLRPGEAGRRGPAEMYGEKAYYFGSLNWDYYAGGKGAEMDRIRTRTLADVAVAPSLLREGLNVVAIEVVRPPANPCVRFEGRRHKRRTPFDLNWCPCAVRTVRLTAAGADGLVPNAVRPPEPQVWNADVMANDFAMDFGDAAEPLRPIEIVAARNGSFSGEVVVGSATALTGLAATVGELRGPGRIPASAVRIRYGFAWGKEVDAEKRYPAGPVLLGALAETPPKTVDVCARSPYRINLNDPSGPRPVFGAVAPVWVTVDVPAAAPAGEYRGTLTIRAAGARPVEVPIALSVADFTLPDPQDYRTWVELVQSPDTLVVEYGLKRWSDRHFEMIARSMKHLNRIGSRILYVTAICHTNIGNAESMIRWVPRPDGTYTWDFSVMDRYLDTAERHMGTPKVVCFWVWEKFLFPTVDDPKTFEQYRPGQRRPARLAEGPEGYVGRGPKVTVVDPATGKTRTEHLPYLLDPKSQAVWKPLFAELRRRMKKRGLESAMMLGTPSDIVLRKAHFDFFNEVAPGLTWVNHSHFDLHRLYDAGGGKLGYYTTVMDTWFPGDPADGRDHGWQRKELHAHLRSRWGRDYFPLTAWRHMAEVNITGRQRGIGRIGADLWRAVRDRRGRRVGRISSRYPESSWRSNNLCSSLLAPGPDGAVATVRYEMTREGVQECEARIAIERALTDETLRRLLGDDLARRAQDALDQRVRYMIKGLSNLNLDGYIPGRSTNATLCWWNSCGINGHRWFLATDWQARTRTLYRLAGEVQRKLKRP